jgi:hypothetical protein
MYRRRSTWRENRFSTKGGDAGNARERINEKRKMKEKEKEEFE